MTTKTAAAKQAELTRNWARLAFGAGVAASIAANVAASDPTVYGKVVGAWPAVALLLTTHLFLHAQRSFWVKASVLAVAGIAAYVSYFHMVEVARMAGESTIASYLIPFTVDLMMYVATVVLTTKPKVVRRAPARKAATPNNVRKLRTS